MSSRRALVGGGGSGIGRAAAESLSRSGHHVVLWGRTSTTLTDVAADITGRTGRRVDALVADLTAPSVAADLLDRAEEQFGAVDILIVNAGGPPAKPILVCDDADWRAAAELLLYGPLRLARTALPRMAARGYGRLVLVTSGAARRVEPDLALSVVLRTAATSAAKLLSREFADSGVTVNCVAPGATATARYTQVLDARARAGGESAEDLDAAESRSNPAGRPGRPEEVAAAITFLASPEASYINGTTVTVDGGRTETIW